MAYGNDDVEGANVNYYLYIGVLYRLISPESVIHDSDSDVLRIDIYGTIGYPWMNIMEGGVH